MKRTHSKQPRATEPARPRPRATDEELSRFESEGGAAGPALDPVAGRTRVPRGPHDRDRSRRHELLPRGADHRGRVLLLCATAHRHMLAIADALAARLRGHGFAVEIGDASAGMMPPPQDYDVVVLGCPLGFGRPSRLIEAYIEQNRVALAEVPSALFTVSRSGTSRDFDPGGFLEQLSRAVGWQPDLAAAFAGGEPFPRDGMLVRLARWLGSGSPGAPRGDAALRTSWADVEHFADRIAIALAGAAATAERTAPHAPDPRGPRARRPHDATRSRHP